MVGEKKKNKLHTAALMLVALMGVTFLYGNGFCTETGKPEPTDGLKKILASDALFDSDMVGCQVWAVGYRGRIFASSDAGANWIYQESGTGEPLFSVSFVDEKTGWAVGEFGTMLKTENGGKCWGKLRRVTENTLRSVHFIDSRHGWTVGIWSTILSTQDGGETWQDISYKEGNEAFDAILSDVFFIDQYNGWAVGEFSTIIRTKDGGATWEKQSSGLGKDYYLTKVFFKNKQEGWVVGQDGRLLYTQNGGNLWQSLQSPANDLLLDIIVSGNNGFAVGKRGVAIASTDAGKTWKKAELADKAVNWWLGSVVLSGPRGIIVGGNGTILTTRDSGSSWEIKTAANGQ